MANLQPETMSLIFSGIITEYTNLCVFRQANCHAEKRVDM
jgi:hypothetical protein